MYQVRATRRDDGNYDLSYGKGSKKLTAVAVKQGTGFLPLPETGHGPLPMTLRLVKSSWGKWASAVYGSEKPSADSDSEEAATTSDASGDSADVLSDPVPQLKQYFEIADPEQIQNQIYNAPSRDDQVRRWFAAYLYTGFEFKLPETVPYVPPTEGISNDTVSAEAVEPDTTPTTGETEAPTSNTYPPQYRPKPRVS